MGKERQGSRSISREEREITASGCMGGMLHYFDFHHLLFTGGHDSGRMAANSVHHSDLRKPQSNLKGVEAPRNSLEGEETIDQAKTSSSSVVEDLYFEIPVGVQLAPAFDILPNKIKKHSRKNSLLEDEDERRVPQTPETPRTPSLVARLMGISGLPDPAPSPPATARQKQLSEITKTQLKKREPRSSKLHECKQEPRQPLRNINCNARHSDVGSQSLPDTPRASCTRSYDADARLSLQIHRENSNSSSNSSHSKVPVGEYSLPPSPTHYTMKHRRKYQDENRSPRSREYAKEIVKQMKESITNRRENGREDCNLKSKRTTTRGVQKNDAGSCRTKPAADNVVLPPRPVLSAPTVKTIEIQIKAKLQDHIPTLRDMAKPVRVKPSRPPPPPPRPAEPGKCKKGTNERFTARFKKPTPSAPGSIASGTGEKNCSIVIEKNELTPKLFRSPQLNKDENTSSLQPKIPKSCRTRPDQDLEYKYIRSILYRGGFMGSRQSTKRYSPSLPVDPIVFHQLEVELPVDDSRYCSSTLRHRWNRKLLFHLVEELLSDHLDCTGRSIGPVYHDEYNAGRASTHSGSGMQLLRRLWKQVERIPTADCQYIADIDALVAVDMPVNNIRQLTCHPAVAEQANDVAAEVEQEILEELIGETAASLSLSSIFVSSMQTTGA
ncbi:LOW protein: M-phase inducer phosphatase-like protein [Rhynchospora pubera]|uniref:LOW protein: M-phase inducer phosphatase-like protein n=1 Tax=Rhynchospora pubera TaxID=906938 RepID=A0AAV8CV62_9POAL|nr:LOW protein: M-phase inducer phosphatase-like protein [Rhynchospora pubera]